MVDSVPLRPSRETPPDAACEPRSGQAARRPLSSSSAFHRLSVAGLLAIHATLLAWIAYRYSPTIDEPGHLVAGLSHWRLGTFDLYRVNPPLVRMIAALPMLIANPRTDWSDITDAPYLRPEFAMGATFAQMNGSKTFWYITQARWICIPISLVGGYVCYRWAHDLYGAASGLTALVLWCFCPNILGNGALITPDVSAAALGVAANYLFWCWLRQPGWPVATLAGISLGIAELTKSTWIILFAVWPAVWLIWQFATAERRSSIAHLGAIFCVALYILNLGYGFDGSFRRLDGYKFVSRTLGGADAHRVPGNRFANTWLMALPVPVPASFLIGVDTQRRDFEVGDWSYLRGEQRLGGWWYYYLYAIAVKTPLGTIALAALSGLMPILHLTGHWRKAASDRSLCNPLQPQGPGECRPARHPMPSSSIHLGEGSVSPWLNSFTVLAPAIAVIILVSSQTGFNRYLRYAIPAFPFVFIWASRTAAFVRLRDRAVPWNWLVPGAQVAIVVSSLSVFPHNLSYFNELAGGPRNGAVHLLDANIDWGQDLLELKRWCDCHPDADPFQVDYFGPVEPIRVGLHMETAPNHKSPAPRSYRAVSLNQLYEYRHDGSTKAEYGRLRTMQPIATAGYSIQIYHFESSQVAR